jgi:cell division protein FtsN
MAKAAAKKKGASRNSRSGGGGKGVPGWLWLMLGLAIGVFAAFLWHLSELRRDAAKQPQTAASAPKSPANGKAPATDKKPEPAKPAPDEKRFEFYTLLPSQQQVVPGKKSGSTTPPPPKAPQQEPAYVLQAGSFKSEAEADKRRATILMLGLPVKIVKVPVKPGETWYRVVVGPFAGKTAAQSARASLHSNGVEALVLKQQG